MSVKLIGKIINSECYQLIKYNEGGGYFTTKQTKPLFPGDMPEPAVLGIYDDEATARSEFRLICEAAQQFGRG